MFQSSKRVVEKESVERLFVLIEAIGWLGAGNDWFTNRSGSELAVNFDCHHERIGLPNPLPGPGKIQQAPSVDISPIGDSFS